MDRKYLIYAITSVFISVVLLAGAGIWYTSSVSHKNDQRWCRVLVAIDDAYDAIRNSPTVTPAGRRIANEFHQLRVDFRC